MATVQQFRCFLSTLEHGSITAAAEELGYAQPSVSGQIRQLERSLGVTLFHRVGRGVVPSEAGLALRPYAEQVVQSVDAARRAVADVRDVLSGTVHFGTFGTSRIYFGADLVAEILTRFPHVRLEIGGQHTSEVLDDVRRGRFEAAVVALPIDDDGLEVEPIMREELVYVSANPQHLLKPVTPKALMEADLVLSDVSWRYEDPMRRQLARMVQEAGGILRPRVEVEDVETALGVVARGLADTVVALGVLHLLRERLPVSVGWVSLRPQLHETFAIVRRPGVTLSKATNAVVDIVVARLNALAEQARVP